MNNANNLNSLNDTAANTDVTGIDAQKLLAIDVNDITTEFVRQAATFGWIAIKLADADAEVSAAKHERESVYAEAYIHWRRELEAAGKVTEAMIHSSVMMDEDYQTARQYELQAERIYKHLRALSDALRMKSDMLISLGAQMRAEYDMTGMSIRK